jgi:Domain of unknown function (DUF4260)
VKVTLPPVLLRIEGATLLALSALLYGLNEGSWLLFVLLFLVPDVSMLGYLAGSRVGAASYNFVPHLRRVGSSGRPRPASGELSSRLRGPRVVRTHRVRPDGRFRAEVSHTFLIR